MTCNRPTKQYKEKVISPCLWMLKQRLPSARAASSHPLHHCLHYSPHQAPHQQPRSINMLAGSSHVSQRGPQTQGHWKCNPAVCSMRACSPSPSRYCQEQILLREKVWFPNIWNKKTEHSSEQNRSKWLSSLRCHGTQKSGSADFCGLLPSRPRWLWMPTHVSQWWTSSVPTLLMWSYPAWTMSSLCLGCLGLSRQTMDLHLMAPNVPSLEPTCDLITESQCHSWKICVHIAPIKAHNEEQLNSSFVNTDSQQTHEDQNTLSTLTPCAWTYDSVVKRQWRPSQSGREFWWPTTRNNIKPECHSVDHSDTVGGNGSSITWNFHSTLRSNIPCIIANLTWILNWMTRMLI